MNDDLWQWRLEKKPNGLYVLKALNDPTGPYGAGRDKRVAAFPEGHPFNHNGPVEWAIAEVLTTERRKGYMCVS